MKGGKRLVDCAYLTCWMIQSVSSADPWRNLQGDDSNITGRPCLPVLAHLGVVASVVSGGVGPVFCGTAPSLLYLGPNSCFARGVPIDCRVA